MGDKYEDLGPADALPPPPPQQVIPGQDRTELKSAQIGTKAEKTTRKGTVEEEEGEGKYTTAQKVCMLISGIMAILFLMVAIASVVILLTGLKIFP